jgi:hypothetical protein
MWRAEAAGKASILTVGVTTGGWTRTNYFKLEALKFYNDVEDLANFAINHLLVS